MTVSDQVTPAYVREHPKEWSVEVTKGKDGLIHFTIKHSVETRTYHIAHLEVYHQSKLIATSSTPSFGVKGWNAFYSSLSPEDIAESKFDLSDGDVQGSGDDALPMLGLTTIHQFRLVDFVPEQLLKSGLATGASTAPGGFVSREEALGKEYWTTLDAKSKIVFLTGYLHGRGPKDDQTAKLEYRDLTVNHFPTLVTKLDAFYKTPANQSVFLSDAIGICFMEMAGKPQADIDEAIEQARLTIMRW
jgi:hypothetical protein